MITQEQASKVRDIVSGYDDEKKKMFLEKYGSLDADKKQIVISRLLQSETLKPSNASQSYVSGINERMAQSQLDISRRGTITSNIKQNISSPSLLNKGIGALQTIGAPLTALQAGISNPALAVQRGEFKPRTLLGESVKGLTGQKLGEYGDVYRNAIPGVGGQVAGAIGGLTLDIIGPVKALKTAQKAFGGISRMSDSGILKAGDSLVSATKNAEKYAGTKLNDSFRMVDSTKVDPTKFLDEATKLPDVLIKKMEEQFGNLDQLAQNMTIGKLRDFKQLLGKYNPSAFGKEARGLSENIQADDINKAYGATKKLLTETISKSWGEKSANQLMKLEEAFTEVSRASDSVKRTIVDPILQKATKGGRMAGKLVEEGDVTGRTALNTIKKSGPQARSEINRAVNALEHFNRVQSMTRIGKHILSAATYGGAIGAAGSMGLSFAAKKALGEDVRS